MDAPSSSPAGRPPTPAAPTAPPEPSSRRFLTLAEVAEELAVSLPQVRALVRDRSLVGVQIGGRGQWRVERVRLEQYIEGLYAAAAARDPREVDAQLADADAAVGDEGAADGAVLPG